MSAERAPGVRDGPVYVATTNAHKAQEIAAILASTGLDIRPAPDLPEVVEDGETFRANAILKARSAAAALGAPALADDSGLAVEVLDGAPGVHSARYAGENATDDDNNALLVERLTALGVEDPAAAFVCVVVIALPDGTIVAQAEGRVEGVLRWPALGAGGFGYDPYFFHPPSGCRLSELAPEAKNAVSHRGQALRKLAASL
ncbi:MAG: RdgB/HAM1 family non-canonical purine NTP pyrophosphatase [Planctomycetota bacterium]|nr:RdgB/HAM1 family non-canonical purine NTP pyrophosphatase [Planctomycetota bacterium]